MELLKENLKVTILPKKFQKIFPFDEFNVIQSATYNLIYNTNKSAIIATPTGSGKTVIAEIAILRAFNNLGIDGKLLYLSPLKALTYEKEVEFRKFEAYGYKLEVFTGDAFTKDSQLPSISRINKAQIIIATIEKFDSLTRRKRFKKLISSLHLIIVDEIHLLSSESRGATLEGLLTRLKVINPQCRIIGLSATIPNVAEIALWLNATAISYGEEYRPSELRKKIIQYNSTGNDFKDKYRRIYKSWLIVRKFYPAQSLIFVTSRGDTVITAKKLVDYIVKENLSTGNFEELPKINNNSLRKFLPYGVAFHHAGLQQQDRSSIENLFTLGRIKTLVATSTLAWGINLPAKVVIIQNLFIRTIKGNEMLASADLWQMLGRAGRPQYDKIGYGYIISPSGETKNLIEIKLSNPEPVVSQIINSLPEIILSEIFREKCSKDELDQFCFNSFYWIQHNNSPITQDKFLLIYEDTIKELENNNLIIKYFGEFRVTPIGSLIAQYYLDIESGKILAEKASKKNIKSGVKLLQEIIKSISLFQNLHLRKTERKVVKEIAREFLAWKEEPNGFTKILVILYRRLQDENLPNELIGDGYIITQSFLRYWSYFKEVYRFFHGENKFKTKSRIWEELF